MRRRLLISLLAVAIVAVLALGIPLAIVLGRLQVDQASQSLHGNAQDTASGLLERWNDREPIGPTYAKQVAKLLPGRYVVIWAGGIKLATGGTKPPPHSYRSASYTTRGGPPFKVTVEADADYLSGNLVNELLLIGGVALLAVGIAVVLGLLYARRLVRPLRNWPARRTGSARVIPARSAGATAFRNSTASLRAWTGRCSGSTT